MLGREPTRWRHVSRKRNKLRATSPMFGRGPAEGLIDNVVQFFNFRNR